MAHKSHAIRESRRVMEVVCLKNGQEIAPAKDKKKPIIRVSKKHGRPCGSFQRR